jgi:large subunit ribosomal protein L32
MSVPKKKRSRSKSKRDATHKKLISLKVVKRKDSDEIGLPHVANKKTGIYKGRQVIDVAKREARAERKRKRGR